MANIAEAVGPGFHAGEGGVDLMDEFLDLKTHHTDRYGSLELMPAVDELPPEDRIYARGHQFPSICRKIGADLKESASIVQQKRLDIELCNCHALGSVLLPSVPDL
jgi:hypothetical protein